MLKRDCKYKTFAELANAFASGELDKEKYILVMDNDSSGLQYRGDDMQESEAYEHTKSLFSGGGPDDIVDVCNAAGIPAEWC